MPDYIASSRKITDWLDGLGITEVDVIELDEFAPKVWAMRERVVGMPTFYVGSYPPGVKTAYRYICPYFGPGGEGNSLKALLALGYEIDSIEPFRDGDLCCFISDAKANNDRSKIGKTCGEIFHDLLEKLMEESKNV